MAKILVAKLLEDMLDCTLCVGVGFDKKYGYIELRRPSCGYELDSLPTFVIDDKMNDLKSGQFAMCRQVII